MSVPVFDFSLAGRFKWRCIYSFRIEVALHQHTVYAKQSWGKKRNLSCLCMDPAVNPFIFKKVAQIFLFCLFKYVGCWPVSRILTFSKIIMYKVKVLIKGIEWDLGSNLFCFAQHTSPVQCPMLTLNWLMISTHSNRLCSVEGRSTRCNYLLLAV